MSPEANQAVNTGSAPGIGGNPPVVKMTGTPESRGDIVRQWLLKNTGKATL